MTKLRWKAHKGHAEILKEFYHLNKYYMTEQLKDSISDAIECLNYVEEHMKHGHWRKDIMGYDVYIECSECGTSLSMSNYIENEWRELMRYCPCCGSIMDGGAENA